LPSINVDFKDAIKGKSKISSCNHAIDNELAKAKVQLNEFYELYRENINNFEIIAAHYKHIFHDLEFILNTEKNAFVAIVKNRIVEHKEAEAKRIEQENARKKAQAERMVRELIEQQKAAKNISSEKKKASSLENPIPKTEMVVTKESASSMIEESSSVMFFNDLKLWRERNDISDKAFNELLSLLKSFAVYI